MNRLFSFILVGCLTLTPAFAQSGGTIGDGIPNNAVLPGSPTTTTQSATDNSTNIATTAYTTTGIANAIAAVNPATAVTIATTAAGDTSGLTYLNGVAGIGATLTGTVNTALTIDGVTLTTLNQRILVKNDTQSVSGSKNGVYYLSQLQTGILPPILTRALDYDQPSDINFTGAIPVISGTAGSNTLWLLTTQVTTIGTDPISYTQFSSGASAANPSATAGPTAVNGSASTYMRSDGSPAVQKGSNAQFGLVEGDTTTITCVVGVCSTVGGGSTTIVAPQGRLTLVTGVPVMVSDQTAKSTIYYDCYQGGKNVPYYTGSADALDTIASCEVSLVMQTSGTGVTNTAGVFDIWWVHGGASRICVATNGSGGGWASDTSGTNTARGTGYSAVHNTRGYYTNTGTIASCYNGTTNYGSISADQATYLGTVYTTAAGQTGMAFKPAVANGGSNNILGVWNAYNRVRVSSISHDNTANWAYNNATWRASNNSTSNRVSWVDGLGQSGFAATLVQAIQSNSAGVEAIIGIGLDTTSATPAETVGTAVGTAVISASVSARPFPTAGFHFMQAMEYGTGSTCTFYGAANSNQQQSLVGDVDM